MRKRREGDDDADGKGGNDDGDGDAVMVEVGTKLRLWCGGAMREDTCGALNRW